MAAAALSAQAAAWHRPPLEKYCRGQSWEGKERAAKTVYM
jgi:hypothetical protein